MELITHILDSASGGSMFWPSGDLHWTELVNKKTKRKYEMH